MEKIAELEASKPKKEDAPEDVIELKPMAETEKTCPVCGVKSDSKFCPECGAPRGDKHVNKKRGEHRSSSLFVENTHKRHSRLRVFFRCAPCQILAGNGKI